MFPKSDFNALLYVLGRSVHRCEKCEKLGIDNQMEEFNLQLEPKNILLRCPVKHWEIRPRKIAITNTFLRIFHPLIKKLLLERQGARRDKDYKHADGIRELVGAFGVEVMDGRDGFNYERKRGSHWYYQFNPAKMVNTIYGEAR